MTKTKLTKPVRKALDYTEDWYSTGLRSSIPSVDDAWTIASMVGSSATLATDLSSFALSCRFIIDRKAPTAYFSLENKTIALPGWYFDGEAITKQTGISENLGLVALTLANGSLIHEGAHSKWSTDKTFKQIHDEAKAAVGINETSPAFLSQVLESICQAIEDFWVERRISAPHMRAMLQHRISILMPLEKVTENLSFEEKGKEALAIIENRVNALILMKNTALASLILEKHEAFRKPYEQILSLGRTAAAKLAYEYIIQDIDLEEAQSQANERGDGEGDGASMSAGAMTGSDDESGEIISLTEEEANELAAAFASAIESALEGSSTAPLPESTVKLKFSGEGLVRGKEVHFVRHILRAFSTTKSFSHTSAIDFSFVRLLTAIRNVNHTPGVARKSGSHLLKGRLAQINVTGKVFHNKETQKTKVDTEIAVICDWSGSMGGTASIVLSEAKALANALKKCGFIVHVFTHTGLAHEHQTPLLVKVATLKPSGSDAQLDRRFMLANALDQNQNYDGFVIKTVHENAFNSKTSNKLIIVLSDGSPAGNDYSGNDADEHTRRQIAKVRKTGTKVFALSLVSGVVSDNNKIYGKEFNVDCSDASKREANFKQLILQLQKGGDI